MFDAREFARDSFDYSFELYSGRNKGRRLGSCIREALTLLPTISCLVLDGHCDLDPNIAFSGPEMRNHLLLLSLANCPFSLPATFFHRPDMEHLVYLDASGIRGSFDSMLHHGVLPNLRILKIRNREFQNNSFNTIIRHFGSQLWGLDISDNGISDLSVPMMIQSWFRSSLRSDTHFLTEGRLISSEMRSPSYGQFIFIEESEQSGSFSNPDRYFVDAPRYAPYGQLLPPSPFRSDGQRGIRTDSLDSTIQVLSGQDPNLSDESIRNSHGITHLRLSNSGITSFGIESLLRNSGGHLEDLACDNMPLITPSSHQSQLWPKGVKLYGILNAAHFVRPVFSSNLRVLRLHHSFVTQVPTLEMGGLSTMARWYISENSILPRAEKLYPQCFVPDMNPRLTSLTLTHIPRRSSGPLIHKLVQFLKLLSVQERSIFDAKAASIKRRGTSGVLDGLRHVRLEFDADPREDDSMGQGVDAEGLMNSGERGFSFFNEEAPETQHDRLPASAAPESSGGDTDDKQQDERMPSRPEYLSHPLEGQGGPSSIPSLSVWIGNKEESRNYGIEDYRRLALSSPHVRDVIGPPTPSQVIAGVPPRSPIFQTAWCMAVMPQSLAVPSPTELEGMKDVLEELRRFRLVGKAKYMRLKEQLARDSTVLPGEPHGFWAGKLEVSREEAVPWGEPSRFWR